MTKTLSPVLVNLTEQVTFGLDSGNVPKLWLVFSNLMSASPAAKAHNPKMDNMVAKISFFIILMFIGFSVANIQ
jgi:hypothetical protein